MKNFRVPVFCLLITFSSLLTRVTFAAPGDLDTTFANGGLFMAGFGGTSDYAHSSVLQSDGKTVILGYSENHLTLVRLNTDGTPDATFGYLGKVTFSPSDYPSETPEFVRLQTDGKIVVASDSVYGSSYYTVISRFNTDGTLDTSFGSPNGYIARSFTSYQSQKCNALAILNDGRIAFAGTYYTYGGLYGEPRYYITRILSDGNYDPVLTGGGFTSTNYSSINDMIIESDNKFLVVGSDNLSCVMRFNEDGTRDSGFGNGGKVVISSANLNSVAIQAGDFTVQNPDRIVVAGSQYVAPSNDVYIARMSLSGVLDTSFGGGAGYITRYVGPNPSVKKVLVLSSGFNTRTIYVMGVNYPNGTGKIFLAKFSSGGTLDTTYGGGVGVVSASTGPSNDDIYDASSVSGGRLLLTCAPNPDPGRDNDYTVVRFTTSTGLLDSTFGNGGILEYNVGDLAASPAAVAIQNDGKILIGGNANNVIGVMRLNGNGSYDTNFAGTGKMLFSPSEGSYPQASTMTLLPDGRFLLGGQITINGKANVLLARFLSNGVPDTTFGTNASGVVTTAVGTNDAYALALRFQNDGKILVGGSAAVGGTSAYLVMRYLSNGVLDGSWNGTGFNITGVGSMGDTLAGITVMPDGKVALGGGSGFNGGSAQFSMTRYLTNGTLDNSFGSFGRLAFSVGPADLDAARAFLSQPDGKLLMAGYALNSAKTDADIAVARLNTNGSFDTSFNGSGKLIASIGLSIDYSTCAAVQNDNKIMIGAATTIGSTYHFGLMRLTSDGQLDSDFGYGGRNYYDFGTGQNEMPVALALDAAGRVVMVGGVNNVFGAIRVMGNPLSIRFTSIQPLPNGHMQLKGVGVPSSAHSLLQASAPAGASYNFMDTINADASGNWIYEDTTAGGTSNRFYRLSYP